MLATILEFPAFQKDADRLFNRDELDKLRLMIASNPEAGLLIPGTGGLRKLRVGLRSKQSGKRGGARVIYYYHDAEMPIALIAVYAKGEKLDLTPSEKKDLTNLVNEFVLEFKTRRKRSEK